MRDPNLVLTVASPERIILFGSRARGEERPDSDYDLIVEEGKGGVLRSAEIRRAIGSVGQSVDVLTATPRQMEDRRNGIIHVLAVAQREGQTLYAA